jgi:hypothetical protein
LAQMSCEEEDCRETEKKKPDALCVCGQKKRM